ncbi:MAG: phosphate uptake regulator PhoU [Thermoplasmata archaeon]|nr:phosphate uptake regulator PhoU [Thermoplasmata archaeon]
METRKVQLTGGSSFVVTLPKEWITRNEIKKHDPLGLIVQPDGSIVITPKTEGEKERRTIALRVDGAVDSRYLYRVLISTYVQGYSVIEIRSSPRIQPLVRATVNEFTQTTVGPEIMEEESDRIVVKDLLDPAEMPFENTIKRLYILVRTMALDAVKGLRERDRGLVEDVMMRDGAIDRLNWLVSRQSAVAMMDSIVARRMNVGPDDATFYFLVSRIIERIGDHAVLIASSSRELIAAKPRREVVAAIDRASEVALDIFTASINAWSRSDILAANQVVESVRTIDEHYKAILDNAFKARGPTSVAEANIAYSLRRIAEYSGDISELTINRLVKTLDAA